MEQAFRVGDWTGAYFVYDEQYDLYRLSDGEFTFSKEYANERQLREMGLIG